MSIPENERYLIVLPTSITTQMANEVGQAVAANALYEVQVEGALAILDEHRGNDAIVSIASLARIWGEGGKLKDFRKFFTGITENGGCWWREDVVNDRKINPVAHAEVLMLIGESFFKKAAEGGRPTLTMIEDLYRMYLDMGNSFHVGNEINGPILLDKLESSWLVGMEKLSQIDYVRQWWNREQELRLSQAGSSPVLRAQSIHLFSN